MPKDQVRVSMKNADLLQLILSSSISVSDIQRLWSTSVDGPWRLLKRPMRLLTFVLLLMCPLVQGHAQTAEHLLNKLADRFVDQQLNYDPTLAYRSGLPSHGQNRFADRSVEAVARFEAQEHEDFRELLKLPVQGLTQQDRITYAQLRERLESDLQLRVCRTELWDVNHFDGWQSHLVEVAEQQSVDTREERSQALQRWSSMPQYINVEIANLRSGLAEGYSAPQSVVRRVILQIDALRTNNPEQSLFYSPARRSGSRSFQRAFRQLIAKRIDPALKVYREFLQRDYLPKARAGIAISDLPRGDACYQAFLRSSTTLRSTPKEIFEEGQALVSDNAAAIAKIGIANYGTADREMLLAKIKSKPSERFRSKEDLLEFSQNFLQRAKSVTAAQLVSQMPRQDVVIRPLPAFEEDAGVGSRFQQESDPGKPAVFLIKLGDWKNETRADAEITLVHETVPGHHLQRALANSIQSQTRLSKLIDNDAYSEGWARYAESLGEEAQIYDTDDAAVMRRLWPAHGMVVDTGLHAFHWTREQAIDYIVSSGRFSREVANDYVDRIAVMPGQLASYDSGWLEIERLRDEAEKRLGASFKLRCFNQSVLEEGVVPLGQLRAHLETWITVQQSRQADNCADNR